MTQQTLPKKYIHQAGHTFFIAGLQWQYLPLRGKRSMRLRAREADANYWATLPTGEGQALGTLLGTVNIADTGLFKGNRKKLVSMALAILPALPRSCYAVFNLPDGQYWFIAVIDGMISPFGDVVGDELAIRSALSNFQQISSTPDDGWTIYAPDDFLPDTQTENHDLFSLLENKTGIRRARLYKTNNKKAILTWVALLVVLAGGYWGYSLWQTHQEQLRIEAGRQLILAQQKLAPHIPADNLKPWADQPLFPEMLSACSAVWKVAHISIAGWVFNNAKCDSDGKITLHYSLPTGGTVGDFAARLLELYGPDTRPVFNIPGPADDASYTLPVPLSIKKHPEPLLPGDQQIQHLTSYAQRINARLRLAETDVATQVTNGQATNLAWRTYSFTFITAIPPDRLFAPTRFLSNGMRATSISTELKNNRFEYTIEGFLYANK
jgi:hypothetical protein